MGINLNFSSIQTTPALLGVFSKGTPIIIIIIIIINYFKLFLKKFCLGNELCCTTWKFVNKEKTTQFFFANKNFVNTREKAVTCCWCWDRAKTDKSGEEWCSAPPFALWGVFKGWGVSKAHLHVTHLQRRISKCGLGIGGSWEQKKHKG